MKKTIICVDPGASGAIAILYETGALEVEVMPETMADIWDYISHIQHLDVIAYIENVGQYVPGNSGPAAAKFSRHVGQLEMALYAAGIPAEKVAPATWMKGIGVPKMEKADRKRWIKDTVQRHYPGIKVTLQTADALGMLMWASRVK